MSALRVLHATPSPASRIPLRLSAACALLLGLTGGLAAQVTVDVDQVLNDFVRADVTINVGDTVRWNWTSGVHDVLEGVDEIIDPTDAFFGPLTMVDPVFTHKFSPKFLFENPRHGHVYPYVCSPHFFEGMTGTVTVISPWANLGFALAGGSGAPLLWGLGSLGPGSSNSLLLENAATNSACFLFVGPSNSAVPFKGGIFVPFPFFMQIPLVTTGTGTLFLPFTMPAGLTGIDIFLQVAVQDAGAPAGVALSNAVRMTGT